MKSTAIKPNDVLLNITGASIGRASLIPEDFPKANLNQHVCILRPRKENISPDFLHLVVSSNLIQNQIFAYENGTSREGLNFSQVGSLLVSLPSLNEQKDIVKQVREYEERIFSLSAGIENQIQKLKEYRQSLISAAVTGKIDVRDEIEVVQSINTILRMPR
jgi:type I restriction enzyme S subunit